MDATSRFGVTEADAGDGFGVAAGTAAISCFGAGGITAGDKAGFALGTSTTTLCPVFSGFGATATSCFGVSTTAAGEGFGVAAGATATSFFGAATAGEGFGVARGTTATVRLGVADEIGFAPIAIGRASDARVENGVIRLGARTSGFTWTASTFCLGTVVSADAVGFSADEAGPAAGGAGSTFGGCTAIAFSTCNSGGAVGSALGTAGFASRATKTSWAKTCPTASEDKSKAIPNVRRMGDGRFKLIHTG